MKRALFLVALLLCNSCIPGGTALAANPPDAKPHYKVMYLVGPIDDRAAMGIIQGFMEVDLSPTKVDGIIIEINSGGGDFDSGFVISKIIETSPIPVMCIVDGEAASMAFYILQSCQIRAMTDRSTLMWHSVSLVGGGVNSTNIESLGNRIAAMNRASAAHVAKRMNISKETVADKIKNHDWWMAADEALLIGAVDVVID